MTGSIVTDSSSALPDPVCEAYGIRRVPLHLLVGERDLREGVDDIGPDLYNDPTATTSGASAGDMHEVMTAALDDSGADGVVAVMMSRRLSGTWAAARMVADRYPDRIRVVDSRSVGFGVGFAAVAAAQAAADGADRDGVYEAAIRAAATNVSLVVVQTLDNLRSGGRISAATRLFGSALSIKPVIGIVEGTLTLRERHRTFSKAVDRMIDAVVDDVRDSDVAVGVMHTGLADTAHDVAQRLGARLGSVSSAMVNELGAVLARHVGSGSVAVTACPYIAPIAGADSIL